jgi:hypothetical protein
VLAKMPNLQVGCVFFGHFSLCTHFSKDMKHTISVR